MESIGKNELIRGQEKYTLQKKLLMIHVTRQREDVQHWRVVVLDDLDVKPLLVSELHSVPYSAHPRMQWTIGKVKRYFWWKGMAGDIKEYVESCPAYQLGKIDHTLKKGSLQSLTLPEVNWQEVSIDFITDLPAVDTEDSIMTVVDCATKMVHLIPCKKTTTVGKATLLYWKHVVKLHRVPWGIHTDRGAQFVGRWWREIWSLQGMKFVCLLINYNDAFDKTNVMASINERQRSSVRTMGTSKPSLTGQCPPIKKGPNPIPYPHRHPPKTTDKSLQNQENSNFAPQK